MTPFLITFRETVEIAFVIAALYGFIKKVNLAQLNKYLWFGVVSGVGLSIVLALILKTVFGELSHEAQEAVEVVASIVGILMISVTVLMFENMSQFHQFVLKGVDKVNKKFADWWVFILVFLTIMRDGVETIIFLFGTKESAGNIYFYGGLGVIAAVILGFVFYRGLLLAPVGYFFKATNFFFLFFAAGMFSHLFEEVQDDISKNAGNTWSTAFSIAMYLVYFGVFALLYKLKKHKQVKQS